MDKYRRRRLVSASILIVVLLGIGYAVVTYKPGPGISPAQLAAQAERARLAALSAKERTGISKAERLVNVALPTAEGANAPPTPTKLFVKPLGAHLVVGFVPYWTLSSFASGALASDIANASELVYSSVCVGGDGSLITTPVDCANGMSGLASSDLPAFMQLAHAAGDRVLLSVQTIDPGIIHSLATHPASLAPTLERNLYRLVTAYGFDGINIDIEGRGVRDRSGFVSFVHDFSVALRSSDPKLDLMVDTYPQSAASSTDFYDVARLSRSVNRLFVMAYAMQNARHSSANSPLGSPTLGWSDVQTLMQYRALVPASKIILGLPFYGLNFATKTDRPGSTLRISSPGARLYDAIMAAGRPPLWDVASASPYAVFQASGGWHQDWYDDPVSLALKSALAQVFHISGVGVWAMSMEGGDTQMISALTGETNPVKLPLVANVANG